MIGQLNPEQLAAVTTASKHTLVLAGAGSGKTKVLTTRMAWLIQNGKVSPYGVLAVTFTNKAAREMLTRLTAMLPVDTRGMWVGTFHGLCNRLLRAHYRDAGLPQNFQILDIADQLAAIKRLIKANDIDDEKFPPRDVQRFINNAKENGERPEHVEVWDAHRKRLAEIYQLYQEQCQREALSILPNYCCAPMSCCRVMLWCASTISGAFVIFWSTSFRTPIHCNTSGSVCWPAAMRRCLPWVTMTSPFTLSVAPTWAICPLLSATMQVTILSGWSRTTVLLATFWMPPMR